MLLKLTRKFSAAHRLPLYDGPCNNLHGHTWKVVFLIEGSVKQSGMVEDFKVLKKLLDDHLPDHQYLNDIVDNPTAENLAPFLFNKINAVLKERDLSLKSIELWENEHAAAVFEG